MKHNSSHFSCNMHIDQETSRKLQKTTNFMGPASVETPAL